LHTFEKLPYTPVWYIASISIPGIDIRQSVHMKPIIFRRVPVSDWVDSLIGWFQVACYLVSSLSPICNPNFSFMGGVGKKRKESGSK
jgi:hypothetical protein